MVSKRIADFVYLPLDSSIESIRDRPAALLRRLGSPVFLLVRRRVIDLGNERRRMLGLLGVLLRRWSLLGVFFHRRGFLGVLHRRRGLRIILLRRWRFAGFALAE